MTTSFQVNIFRRLHASLLQPQGFRKVSSRSERATGLVHQALACYSSRFNAPGQISFTLEFRVSHEAFFHLYQPGKKFPGLGERAFGPLFMWRPNEANTQNERWWHIESSNKKTVEESVIRYMQDEGMQILEQTRTIDGILEFCEKRSEPRCYQPLSWVLHHIGRSLEARAIVEAAIKNAPHENARNFASAWLTRLGL